MRIEIIWEIRAKNTPLLKRKCNRCDNNSFYCSEKFRINAQKKKIDIWLIYKCGKCDNTYNMTILNRTNTATINKDLFDKFSENNLETVWEYAFSQETARKNNVTLDYGSVKYDIDYNNKLIGDILGFDSNIVSIKIKYPFDFRLKLSSIVRTCLNLSANQLNQLIEAKVISVENKDLQKKYKVKNQIVFQVNLKGIKAFLCNIRRE
ncbi:MAG: DUF1062 domain-containing protein [Bacteroidota bacterium]